MTREDLRKHCERQIEKLDRVKRSLELNRTNQLLYEEHDLILELLDEVEYLEYHNADWKFDPFVRRYN